MWGLSLWCMGSPAVAWRLSSCVWRVGSSFPTRNRACNPCLARQILNHWTTRLAPQCVSPGLGKGGEWNATHSGALAWRIPGTGAPGGLPSVGSHGVGHDWSDLAAAAAAGESSPVSSPSSTRLFVVVGPVSVTTGRCLLLARTWGRVWPSPSCITLSDRWLLLRPPAVPALRELCPTLQAMSFFQPPVPFLTPQSLFITAPGSKTSSLELSTACLRAVFLEICTILTPAAYPLPQTEHLSRLPPPHCPLPIILQPREFSNTIVYMCHAFYSFVTLKVLFPLPPFFAGSSLLSHS